MSIDVQDRMAGIRPEPETTCPGSRHGGTQDAWRHGCRHPGAVAAHEQWVTGQHPDETCPAGRHGTNLAWLEGCRSAAAVAAHDKAVRRKHAADVARRGREYSRLYAVIERKVMRQTGRRLYRDPRAPWRSGKMAVDRNNLWQLMHGFTDSPTVGEMVAAVARLDTTVVPSSPWTSRRINNFELSNRLGLQGDRQIIRMRTIRERLRGERDRRRLADVQWKAAVAAAAPLRRETERARHEAAAARRVAWKQHCRTMRRLRESQERAKAVALAIEKRTRCIA